MNLGAFGLLELSPGIILRGFLADSKAHEPSSGIVFQGKIIDAGTDESADEGAERSRRLIFKLEIPIGLIC